jgi:hypothetical protein
MSWLLVLDDDPARLAGFEGRLPRLGSGWRLKAWTSAERMIAELDDELPQARFICLEGRLSPPVAAHLAMRTPTCPVTLHWRQSTRDPARQSLIRLSGAGWQVELVRHGSQHWGERWLEEWLLHWIDEVQILLSARPDTKANPVHAANCERLRAQFEGCEAIYLERYVRRVKVECIRANVDARQVCGMADEILTPGLGAPGAVGRERWWEFSAGYEGRFSRESWSLSTQGVNWHVYFNRDLIQAVVAFAATLPSDEVYQSTRLMKLIRERGREFERAEEPLFPD